MTLPTLNLETNPRLFDDGFCRKYAFDSVTKACYVIIENGRGMIAWGLPPFSVFTAAKPFSEPCNPIHPDQKWTLIETA